MKKFAQLIISVRQFLINAMRFSCETKKLFFFFYLVLLPPFQQSFSQFLPSALQSYINSFRWMNVQNFQKPELIKLEIHRQIINNF